MKNLIKLNEVIGEFINHQYIETGVKDFYLNPAMIIKVEPRNGAIRNAHVTYREAMVNGCDVRETPEEIFKMANE